MMGLYSNPKPLDEDTSVDPLPVVTEGAEPTEVVPELAPLKEGDSVIWKGFPLTVIEIRPDGCIRLDSLQWKVTISDESLITRV
jgi:hypothetical protein